MTNQFPKKFLKIVLHNLFDDIDNGRYYRYFNKDKLLKSVITDNKMSMEQCINTMLTIINKKGNEFDFDTMDDDRSCDEDHDDLSDDEDNMHDCYEAIKKFLFELLIIHQTVRNYADDDDFCRQIVCNDIKMALTDAVQKCIYE